MRKNYMKLNAGGHPVLLPNDFKNYSETKNAES